MRLWLLIGERVQLFRKRNFEDMDVGNFRQPQYLPPVKGNSPKLLSKSNRPTDTNKIDAVNLKVSWF